jgi:CheY-like chemotaxis protein
MSEKQPRSDKKERTPTEIGNEMRQELEEWRAMKEEKARALTESKPKVQSELSEALSAPPPSKTIAEILTSSSIEFRDALQNIRGFLELLVSGKVTDERQAKQFLGIAYRESQYLSNRVSDLLVASLIETDKLRVKPSTLSIDQLLQTAIQEMTPAAMGKGLDFEVDAPSELPTLKGDEALLHQVLINLLDETIKDTPRDGQVLVRIAHKDTSLLVQIAGFSGDKSVEPSSLALINDAKFHGIADLSLSMYVVEQIVKAHDGDVSTTRTQEDTRIFNIILPLKPTTRMRGKILIVEDNPHLVLLISFALEKEGFQAFKASNGLEAVEIAKSEDVDLVILDIMLPGIDGFEVCHRLRSMAETAATRVIMISAKTREEDRAAALRVGADAYFRKPLGMTELIAAVENLLEDSQDDYRREKDDQPSTN